MKISIMVLTYNRNIFPCLKAIKKNTRSDYELILVDNNPLYNNNKLYDDDYDYYIGVKDNEGVLSRNYGKLIAKYDYIACIDDDVTVEDGWDEVFITTLEQDKNIYGVGPQGHKAYHNLSNYNKYPCKPGQYADVLTGYCWMHKNIPEGLLPWDYVTLKGKGSHIHDETYVQFQMREKGGRFKVTPNVCVHNSQRSHVDWADHDEKVKRIQKRFDVKNLNLEK